jgi:hypothetical protein
MKSDASYLNDTMSGKVMTFYEKAECLLRDLNESHDYEYRKRF